jgi:hypothetical protein
MNTKTKQTTTQVTDPRATVDDRAIVTHICECGGIIAKDGNRPGKCTRCGKAQATR